MEQKQIESFLDNLDLVLHDQVLENEKIVLEFYWDTADVRNALLGQAAFYDSEETNTGERVEIFDNGKFQDDRALVHCLEGAGYFGPIKLLQPHQVELYKLIDREFEIGAEGPPMGGPARFLEDVGLAGFQGIDLNQIAKLTAKGQSVPEQITNLVRKQAGSAAKLFKAVQSIKHRGWKSRLARLVRDKLIQIDHDPYDYRSLMETNDFELLLIAFSEERCEKDTNNFSDAVALCQLAQKTRKFQDGSGIIPRFFPRRLERDVIEKTGLDKRFTYEYEGNTYTIFRDIDYYKLKATLSHSGHVETNPKAALKALRDTRKTLVDIRNAQKTLTPKALDTMIVAGQRLSDILLRLREYWFLEQIWLPFAAATEMMDVIKEHVQTARDLNSSLQFRRAMEAEVRQIKLRLDHESTEYQRISRFWNELHKSIRKTIPEGTRDLDLFKAEGVLRFGFTPDAQTEVISILHGLVAESPESRDSARVEVFQRYQGLTASATDQKIMVVAGVLWSLHMDDEIIALLPGSVEDRHYSLSILLGAACLRSKHSLKSFDLIQQLEERYKTSSDSGTKLNLEIGLGYLYFHYRAYMTSSRITLDERQRNEYLQKAVKYGKTASSSESHDLKRRAYAANQYLFYMLNGHEMFQPAEIKLAAERLLGFEENADAWQYRYDDTLATYFEHLADNSKQNKRRWLETAMARMDRAWESGKHDEYVVRHRERLMLKTSVFLS